MRRGRIGRGIGREYALLLAARGAAVVVNDLGLGTMSGEGGDSRGPADSVVREIVANGGRAVASYDSVTSEHGVRQLMDLALDAFGQIDVVINNAGIVRFRPFTQATEDVLKNIFEVHVVGSMLTARTVWPHFLERGYGRIINTTSGGIFGAPMLTEYTAAKGAVFAMTRSLAAEAARTPIRVNCVGPGAATRMMLEAEMPPEAKERALATLPPALIAPAVVYLAHESCTLNGETLSLQGGHVRRIGLTENDGIFDLELTPEIVRDRLSEILDEKTSRHWADTYSQSQARAEEEARQ